MNIDLSDEALEYGRLARQALESAGGDQLVQAAEADPDQRKSAIEPVLSELGAWELDVRGSADELEAAAALCRSAGYWAIPYPVAERLCRPTDVGGTAGHTGRAVPDGGVDGLIVVADTNPAGPVADLGLRWAAVDLDGGRFLATPWPSQAPPRKSAFVTGLELQPVAGASDARPGDVALAVVLPCWTLLGMLDRAVELACSYALEREQFGQALASFQGVQFQLTDAEVERAGVEELAKYALWSIQTGSDEAVADALALRLTAIEAADAVFRVAHQIHGAIGFCDETTLSWVSRYSQPIRRLPLSLSATQDRLTTCIGQRGLSGLFDDAAGR